MLCRPRRSAAFLVSTAAGFLSAQDGTWHVQEIEVPAAAGAIAPELSAVDEGAVLTWLEPAGPRRGRRRPLALRWARYDARTFGRAGTIEEGAPFFANWADFATSCEASDGSLYVHWLQRAGRGAYGIVLARRAPEAEEWRRLGHPHRGGIRGEHGFVSMVPEGRGVRLFWLDGRSYADDARMELRSAVVEGDEIGAEEVLDPDVCTCCQTGAVVATEGPLVVYRGHDENEVRDILYVRRTAEGWSAPAAVAEDGWVIHGCPVNGPAATVAGERVAVAWYTGAADGAGVKVAFSEDAGAGFADPLWVDRTDPVGRVDLVATERGVLLCWLATDEDGGGVIRIREYGPSGTLTPAVGVSSVTAGRSSGFPRMAAVPEGVLLTWTVSGPEGGVRAALLTDDG